MSGLDVLSVDVHVQGVSFEKENKAVAELNESQKKLLEQSKEAAETPEVEVQPVAEEPVAEEAAAEEAPAAEEAAEVVEVEAVEVAEEEIADEDAEFEMDLPEVEEETDQNEENA